MKRKKSETAEVMVRCPRKTWRIFFYILLAGVLLVVALWLYAVNRISYLPDWYQDRGREQILVQKDSTNSSSTTPEPIPAPAEIETTPSSHPMTLGVESETPRRISRSAIINQLEELEIRGKATISEEQVYPLIQATFRESGFDPDLFLKACKTTFSVNHATLELIVDLRHAPHQAFSASGERAWLTVMQMAPEEALSGVYLKMDLFPYKENNMVRFLSGSQLSVGKIAIPLQEVEKKFGLKMQINLDALSLADFQLKDHQLLLCKPSSTSPSN
jgi:hypothetical protein